MIFMIFPLELFRSRVANKAKRSLCKRNGANENPRIAENRRKRRKEEKKGSEKVSEDTI